MIAFILFFFQGNIPFTKVDTDINESTVFIRENTSQRI